VDLLRRNCENDPRSRLRTGVRTSEIAARERGIGIDCSAECLIGHRRRAKFLPEFEVCGLQTKRELDGEFDAVSRNAADCIWIPEAEHVVRGIGTGAEPGEGLWRELAVKEKIQTWSTEFHRHSPGWYEETEDVSPWFYPGN